MRSVAVALFFLGLFSAHAQTPADPEVSASFDSVAQKFPEIYVNASFDQTEMVRKYHKITITDEERKATIAAWKVVSKELKKEGEAWKGNIQLQPEADDEYLYVFELDYVQGIWIPRAGTKVRVGEGKPYREDLFGPDKLLPLPRLGPILEMHLVKVQKARPSPHAGQKVDQADPALEGIWLLTKGVENTQGKRDIPAGSMQIRFTAKDATLRAGLVSMTFPYAASPNSNPPLLRMGPGGPDARNTGLYRLTDPNTLELVQSGLPRGQEPASFEDGDKAGYSRMIFTRMEGAPKERFEKVFADQKTLDMLNRLAAAGSASMNAQGEITALAARQVPFTVDHVKLLRTIGAVEELHLMGNNLNEATVKEIATLAGLKKLSLAVNNMNNQRVEFLKGLPLVELDLSLNLVSDGAIPTLVTFKDLKKLKINSLTPEGIAQLKKTLPGCTVEE